MVLVAILTACMCVCYRFWGLCSLSLCVAALQVLSNKTQTDSVIPNPNPYLTTIVTPTVVS